MADLHDIDHYGLARAMLLKAIRARAATGDDGAVVDIQTALEGLDSMVARGDWWAMVRVSFWLASRASDVKEGVGA